MGWAVTINGQTIVTKMGNIPGEGEERRVGLSGCDSTVMFMNETYTEVSTSN